MNIFNPIDDVKRALFPVCRTLKELINDQECNVVVKVPSNKIAKEMEVPILDSYRKNIEESEILGLKLEIKSSKDEEGDKTETKKKYIIRKMLDVARNETEILFKDPEKTDEIIFSSLSSEEQSSDFKSEKIFFCAIGPYSQDVLNEAINIEKEFNPGEWDIDGFKNTMIKKE